MRLRTAASAALILMFALLGWRLWIFLDISAHALRFPFQLDYGEGIVWQQALMMFTSEAYGRIDGFPAIVFHYPPLYHSVTRGVAALTGGDMLYTGRAISIVSTLLTGLVIGLIVARTAPADTLRSARFLAGACGALAIFCLWPVIFWAQLMRVDMLAFLLSFLGFWAGLKSFERPAWMHATALCFVAAVYTKQTSISAPVALFGLMLWLRPSLARVGITMCTIWGIVTLVLLSWMTGGGFVRHVFLYNINQFEWNRIFMMLNIAVQVYFPFFWVVLSWVALSIADRRIVDLKNRLTSQSASTIAQNYSDTAYLGILCYVVATTLMLVTIGKLGSSLNYLIEWLLTISLLVGTAMYDVVRLVTKGKDDHSSDTRLALSVVVPMAIAAQAFLLKGPDFEIYWNAKHLSQLEALSLRVGATQKPVISDDMVMLLRSGKKVAWEPAIFAQLANAGVWVEHPFIARIRDHEFAMFITVGHRGDSVFDGRYNPAIADAMDKAYPVKEILAGYTLHLPAPKIISAPDKAAPLSRKQLSTSAF